MRKSISLMFVFLLVASALFVSIQPVSAGEITGTVMASDSEGESRLCTINGVVKNCFPVGGSLNFEAKTYDDGILKSMYITVGLYNSNDTLIDDVYVRTYTPSIGLYQSYYYYYGNPISLYGALPGEYELRLYSSGTLLDTVPVYLYSPAYVAIIQTYSNFSYTQSRSLFLKSEIDSSYRFYLYYDMLLADQYNFKPATSRYSSSVSLQINDSKGNSIASDSSISSDENGVYRDSISIYSSSLTEGDYTITARYDYVWLKHAFTFKIVDVTLDLRPSKNVYAQGDTIAIFASSTTLSQSITVKVEFMDEGTWDWTPIQEWIGISLSQQSWMQDYTIPYTAKDGAYRVAIYLLSGEFMGHEGFVVKKYSLSVYAAKNAHLPGETAKMFYTILSNSDGSEVEGAKIEWSLRYYVAGNGGYSYVPKIIKGSVASVDSIGFFDVIIPKDVYTEQSYSYYYRCTLTVWANQTATKNTDMKELRMNVYNFNSQVQTDSQEYVAGDYVHVWVTSFVSEGSSSYSSGPVAGALVDMSLKRGSESIPGYSITGLIANRAGVVDYMFNLSEDLPSGTYNVYASVTKKCGDLEHTSESTREIQIVKTRNLELLVSIDRSTDYSYYSSTVVPYVAGEDVVVNYSVLQGSTPKTDASVVYKLTMHSTQSYSYGSQVIEMGSASDGSFTFRAPDDFSGYVGVEVTVRDSDGHTATETRIIFVELRRLSLDAGSDTYRPGDTIQFIYNLEGDLPSGSKVIYTLESSSGVVIDEGTVSETKSFSLTIPDLNDVPPGYDAVVLLVDSQGKVLAEAETHVTRASALIFSYSLDKDYYLAGETVVITYQIEAMGAETVPDTLLFQFGIAGTDTQSRTVNKSDDDYGKLLYNIPDYLGKGQYFFSVASPSISSYGQMVTETRIIFVEFHRLSLDADSDTYRPGDTIQFIYNLEGDLSSGSKVIYTINSSSGVIMDEGVVSDTKSFALTIPDLGEVPPGYDVAVLLVDSQGKVQASAETCVTRVSALIFSYNLDKEYYSVGETVVITYRVEAMGAETVPDTLLLRFGIAGTDTQSRTVNKSDDDYGKLLYNIPDSLGKGQYFFSVTSPSISDSSSLSSYQILWVEEEPINPLGDKGVTFAGMPLLSLIILALVILSLIIAMAALLRTRARTGESSTPPKAAMMMGYSGPVPGVQTDSISSTQPRPSPVLIPKSRPQTAPPPPDAYLPPGQRLSPQQAPPPALLQWLECPSCNGKFQAPKDASWVECANCGAKGPLR